MQVPDVVHGLKCQAGSESGLIQNGNHRLTLALQRAGHGNTSRLRSRAARCLRVHLPGHALEQQVVGQGMISPIPEHVLGRIGHCFRDYHGKFGGADKRRTTRRHVLRQLFAQRLDCGSTLVGRARSGWPGSQALGDRGCHWDFRRSAGARRMASEPRLTAGWLTSLY